MDDKPHHRTEQRLCYFCQSPGPEFQEIKTEKTQKCSQIWICNNCKEKKNLTSSGYSGTGSGSDGGPSDGESSSDSDIIDSDKYLKMLQNQVFKHKSYLKNCWSELRWALDLLYKAQNDMKVTQAIADLIPRQNELEVYCRTLCKEDSVQLLERLDQQCRSYIVQSKRKLFGVAQQKAPQPYEINYSSRFLTCALDDWEKYHRVSRAVATIIYPMEHACNIHWRTQARCIYHRIIYQQIDIHERLRSTSNHIQQEANIWDEKKDYRYRGILRRYKKFEEHMTEAGKDRDPDICRPTFGEEWRIEGERLMQFDRDLLLADGSSGSDSIPENLSESGSSNYAEAPIDFNKTLLPNHSSFHELWEDTDDYPDGVGIHDVASISSSETTESSESFETDNYPRAVDEVKKIFEQREQAKLKFSNSVSTISRTAAGVSKDLFSETMDKILNSQPTAKVTTTLMTTMTTTPEIIKEEETIQGVKIEKGIDCKDSAYHDSDNDNSDDDDCGDEDECGHGHSHGGCDHDHDHIQNDHSTCRCVHCELLGNTPTHKGDIRNEMMRERLRKKLKERKKQKEDAPSPSLSSSTQSRDKSEVDINRKNSIEKGKDFSSKRPNTHRGFGFGTAMEVRPVRHSTSSKNHDPDHSGHDWKREWIEIASEEFRDIAERENLTVPKDGTLWTLQSSLKSGIELRLDPAFNAQQKLLEEEEERRRKKERERENREKRRKKREAKKKKLQEAKDEEAAEKQTNSTDSGNVPDCPSTVAQSVTDENKPDGDLQTMDEDEDIDCIFAPKECLEDLDPHDRDVEIFKKFCLDSAPILPRLKLPLQSLNLLPLVE